MALTALSSSPLPNIAIVTTDEVAMPEVERLLGPSFNISHIATDARVLPLLAERPAEAILFDLDTAAENTNRGLELLALLHKENEDVVLVAMTRSHARALRQKAEANSNRHSWNDPRSSNPTGSHRKRICGCAS